MLLRRLVISACTLIALVETAWSPVQAQYITGEDGLLERYNPFKFDPSRPVTVTELSKRIDCLTEQLRDDGLIVIKQPDVFSQARLTHFRNDVEQQFRGDLGRFELVLAARINRLDAATTTQTTALSASLAAPGTTNMSTDPTKFIQAVSGQNSPFATGGTSLFGATVDPKASAFGQLGLANSTLPAPTAAASAIGLGVEPTVYLDQKKRFLEHLNEIRRINLGPDQNDSSGYGLYLVRMPVSISPGECTYRGHGADLSVRVEHEFPPEFLPSTFQNLVINDLVDQLGPFIYEVIRTGLLEDLEKFHEDRLNQKAADRKRDLMVESLLDSLAAKMVPKPSPPTRNPFEAFDRYTEPLARFILRELPRTGTNAPVTPEQLEAIAKRIEVLIKARRKYQSGNASLDAIASQDLDSLAKKAKQIPAGRLVDDTMRESVRSHLRIVALSFLAGPGKPIDPLNINFDLSNLNRELYRPFLAGLYKSALADDVAILDNLLSVPPTLRNQITTPLAASAPALGDKLNLNLNTTRDPKQIYPIAPRELIKFFLEDNVYLIANDANESLATQARSTDIRSYLRQTLQSAYYAMSHSNPRLGADPIAPLADQHLLEEILEAIRQREYGKLGDVSHLTILFDTLVSKLETSRENIKGKPIAALCWAIAVDAALLDHAMRQDVRKVFTTHGMPADMVDEVRFYLPKDIPNDMARAIFNDYVKTRWPIITFALDPVTDEQNIADSFNLKRDLQLALSYAFATGQVGFNQLNTFRRQIEQSSDTIALNRTVSAVAHGNDIFGFRFSPRFQNPPNQRTNIGVIASQLIGGGPGPDYGTKKSKLEPGIRELTAVLLMPTFLPTMRINVAGNWFKLTDPEHLIFHTNRAMEQGRRVQELRQAVLDACSTQRYRGDDLRVLQNKLVQLEAMLPMQSKVIQVPYENTASGFDLFYEGATALTPELWGFEGVDFVNASKPADIFLFGKYFNIIDTKVIAGGKVLISNPGDPTNQVDILSREVIRVQIPADATPTTTNDEPSQQYIELHVATPNGISNRVFVPYQATPAAPAPRVAFDLNADSKELDIFYQWSKANLIATEDPGTVDKNPLHITWNAATGMAPKTLQATFSGTVSGTVGTQLLTFSLPANSGTKDDYSVDRQQIILALFQRLQDIVSASAQLPASLTLNITVQPYVPLDSMGYRVQSKPLKLSTPLTVKFIFNSTGTNALQGVNLIPPSAPAKQSSVQPVASPLDDPVRAASSAARDPSLQRTAQGASALPQLSGPAQLPAAVSNLAAGGIPPIPASLATTAIPASLTPATAQTTLAADASKLVAAVPMANQAVQLQIPSFVLTPSPVVVVSPPVPPAKSHSRLLRFLDHNRNDRAAPAKP